jgi:hypothetical protein
MIPTFQIFVKQGEGSGIGSSVRGLTSAFDPDLVGYGKALIALKD